MSIGRLLSTAAAHGARFRDAVKGMSHLPARNYPDSVKEFEERLPEEGMPMDDVLEALVHKAAPGLNLMTGSRFFGWVIGGSHPMGVAADILTSAWGQNAGNHMASPSAAAAEGVAAEWLLELLSLPRDSSVGFVTGATVASFTCLAAARGEVLRKVGWDADGQGLFGAPPITVITGRDAHATLFSGLQYLGMGHDRVVKVDTDDQGRVEVEAFKAAIAKVSGPCIVLLQAGQVNTGAFDDFWSLITIAKSKGAWVHVDGAFGLWARASKKRRHLTTGVEFADSWATDGHKWLQTPYDCGFAIVRDEVAHRRSMTMSASYLPLAGVGERDPSAYVPELSRRARGFPVWAIIKHLGREGVEALVDGTCDAAIHMGSILSKETGIAVLNDIVLNQVLVKLDGGLGPEQGDLLTTRTIQALQRDGTLFAGGALWRGRQVLRISVGNYATDQHEATIAANRIVEIYREQLAAFSEA
jgi:glutamate/tyrosine decarboxylase-like PLP-dependent enzyme